MLFLNFKTYPSSTSQNAVKLAHIAREVSQKFNTEIIVCPTATDLFAVSQVGLPTWSQHVDFFDQGRATGFVPPELVASTGAVGTLLNHSEHKLDFETLSKAHARAKAINLKTLIFAADLDEAKKVSALNPDYIGYEPPELVGSSEISVSEAKPEVVKDVVNALPHQKIIVGAGIKSANDSLVAISLGAVGIAVASSITKSENPKEEIEKLVKPFLKN